MVAKVAGSNPVSHPILLSPYIAALRRHDQTLDDALDSALSPQPSRRRVWIATLLIGSAIAVYAFFR